MANSREFVLSNGDTPDYVKLEFESWTEQGKILTSFFQVVISKSERIFDFKRKCWFVSQDVIDPLLKGIQTLIDQGTLRFYRIIDNRIIIEDFEDFFTQTESGSEARSAETKEVILAKFIFIVTEEAKIDIPYDDTEIVFIGDAKPYYRKAALALHPDRNNGDGSKMSELNRVWALLQTYLK